ncbi:MAG: alpha-galactosidase, partial [Actinomycetota bacterium]|nr:alpha-galactosidase [Actinomycetota bacterium]
DAFRGVLYPLLADPSAGGWTALQSWDPEAGRGALLAFRQQAGADNQTIALRNVPPGRTFDLYEAPSGAFVRTVTSTELSSGLTITLPATNTAKVLLIQPRT